MVKTKKLFDPSILACTKSIAELCYTREQAEALYGAEEVASWDRLDSNDTW